MSVCPSFCPSACTSVRSYEQLCSHWTVFHEIWYLSIMRITVTLHEDQYTFFISRSFLLRLGNVLDKNCRENQNTCFIFNNIFQKIVKLFEIMWKNTVELDRPPIAIWQNAHCMLDTYGYGHMFKICNTYCFSTATIVAQKCLNVTLCVHCLFCLYLIGWWHLSF